MKAVWVHVLYRIHTGKSQLAQSLPLCYFGLTETISVNQPLNLLIKRRLVTG